MTKYKVALESYIEVEAETASQAFEKVTRHITNIDSDSKEVVVSPRIWYSVQDENGEELFSEQSG